MKSIAFRVKSYVKSKEVSLRYKKFQKTYGTNYNKQRTNLLRDRIKKYNLNGVRDNPKILFVADTSGWLKEHIIPALECIGKVDVFEVLDAHIFSEEKRNKNGRELIKILRTDKYDCVFLGGIRGQINSVALEAMENRFQLPVFNFQLDDKQVFSRIHQNVEVGVKASLLGSTVTMTNSKYALPWYDAVKSYALYLPEGSSPDLYKPLCVDKKYDVAFFGSLYGFREELYLKLKSRGINVNGFGPGWDSGFLSFEEQNRKMNESWIILSHEGIGYDVWPAHIKGKTFDIAMSGGVLLTSFSSELADWFQIGKEVLCYSNPDDAYDIIEYYLQHKEELLKIGRYARDKVHFEHTWENRFRFLIDHYNHVKSQC